MTSSSRHLVPLVLASILAWAAPALACTDAGVNAAPAPGPRAPFEPAPGCVVRVDPCGDIYREWCDGGTVPPLSDGGVAVPVPPGTPMCSPYVEDGRYTPYEGRARYACTSTAQCREHHLELTCGDDGFCACPTPPPAAGCSASNGSARAGWAWMLAAAVVIVARHRARSKA